MKASHPSSTRIIFFLCSVAVMAGCNTKPVVTTDDALKEARGNREEIEDVLSYFNQSDNNYKDRAARYLVSSMTGRYTLGGDGMDSVEAIYDYMKAREEWTLKDSAMLDKGRRTLIGGLNVMMDLESLNADYLIENINRAYDDWKGRKWNSELGFEEFCELLLPYRIGDEPVTKWREPYKNHFDFLADSLITVDNSVEAAKIVSRNIERCHYNIQFPTPHRSALRLLDNPIGSCREDCDFTLYAMRSLGIPVAIDMVIVSPEYGSGHTWNVVYDTHDRIYRMFDNLRYTPTRDSLHYDKRRKGKVYRYTLAHNLERLAPYRDASHPPLSLTDPFIKDVTAEYFGHNRAAVTVNPVGDKDIYLGIFTPSGIRPVDIASKSGDKAVFTDIEPNLIYFPIVKEGNESPTSGPVSYSPCGLPFMLTGSRDVYRFEPEEERMETVTLTRKYPKGFHVVERFATAKGIHIQASDSPEGPWHDLYVIPESPAHSYCPIPLAAPLKERFLRIYKPDHTAAEIGELIASNDPLGLQPIALSVAPNVTTGKYERIVDGDLLSWAPAPPDAEDLVFQIKSDKAVDYLFFLPHNDDNFVVPQQEYQLLYYSDEGWKSLGNKISQGFSIDFQVPRNAVLLLRNLTKGREEQIFIYREGRQLFNIDLYDHTLR